MQNIVARALVSKIGDAHTSWFSNYGEVHDMYIMI